MATGGSTNAVLHFLAVRLEAFRAVRRDGFPSCWRRSAGIEDPDRINGDCITITGRTIAEELSDGH
jgi:dihydroxyacid dehydratase/phosphogluconate dehydratase